MKRCACWFSLNTGPSGECENCGGVPDPYRITRGPIYWTRSAADAASPRKRRLRICWTCSDFVRHHHRWKWTAALCGRIQRRWARR